MPATVVQVRGLSSNVRPPTRKVTLLLARFQQGAILAASGISGPSPDISVLSIVITGLLSALTLLYKGGHDEARERELWYRGLIEKTLKDYFTDSLKAAEVQGDNIETLVTAMTGMQQTLMEVGKYVQKQEWAAAQAGQKP